jgi:tetratricopeptide (TPR) repeat protein
MAARPDTILADAISDLKGGRLGEAERGFKALLRRQPRNVAALNLLGILCTQQRRFEEAAGYMKKSIDAGSASDATFYNYGIVLKALNRPAEAIEQFDRSLSINPAIAETWNNRGTAFNDVLRFDDALASFDRAIALKPGYADAYSNKGNSLTALRRFDEAKDCFDRAMAINPRSAEAWTGRGNLLLDLNDYGGAGSAFDRALAINPKLSLAWLGRGNLLASCGRRDEALQSLVTAQEIEPGLAEAHFAEACCRLLFDDTRQGWEKYEWRWKTRAVRPHNRSFHMPLWLGEMAIADKTILLHAEQGFGDTIQFCRFVKNVAGLGAHVVLEVQEPLKSLLASLEGVERIIGRGEPVPPYDFHCPLGSLPLALQISVEQLRPGAYLSVPSDCAAPWHEHLRTTRAPRIGLAWAGNPKFRGDHNRSIGLERILPIVKEIDAQFVSLQKELGPGEEAVLSERGIMNCGPSLDSFRDTAALMTCLDLVISSDTSIVHLAGALGQKVWILLQHAADWRWLTDRSDSPWYANAKLFRQPSPGDWTSVVEHVIRELQSS